MAIKKIGLGKAKEGVNVTALREIKLLKELHGPHIVQLLDVFPHKQNLSLVGCLQVAHMTHDGFFCAAYLPCTAQTLPANHKHELSEYVCALVGQVFEYMQTDLEVVIKDRSLTFSEGVVKAYMQMVLQGINFCHKRWVLHRDIKPNNFLISQQGMHSWSLTRVSAQLSTFSLTLSSQYASSS